MSQGRAQLSAVLTLYLSVICIWIIIDDQNINPNINLVPVSLPQGPAMIERIVWPPFLRLRWNSRAKVSSLEGCLKNKKKLKERKGVKLKFKRKSNLYIYISGKLATNRVRTPMKKDLKS